MTHETNSRGVAEYHKARGLMSRWSWGRADDEIPSYDASDLQSGRVSPYSPAGSAALAEWSNEDGPAARRWLRRYRQTRGIQRITIEVYDSRDRTIDGCEVFGWRAALVACRALRAMHVDRAVQLVCSDDELHAARERAIDAGLL